jgi:hypothetical protein
MAMIESQKAHIEKLVDIEIAKFISNIPQTVNTILTKSILSLLGLTVKFNNEYEVDHCNGRRSSIINAVERRVKDAVNILIEPIVAQAIVDVRNDERFIMAIAQEATRVYKQTLKNRITDEAIKFAQIQATAIFNNLSFKLDGIIPSNTDPEDPNSYNTQVGTILLEEIAHQLTKKSQ